MLIINICTILRAGLGWGGVKLVQFGTHPKERKKESKYKIRLSAWKGT